jgi:MFS family permease
VTLEPGGTIPEAVEGTAAPGVPHARRNYALGVASGGLGGLAHAFLHPELILAGMIYALTRSPTLVALVTIVSKAGALCPQLWAATHFEHKARKMPFFRGVALARIACYAVLVGSVCWMARGAGAPGLALFFIAYLAVCVMGGAGHVAFLEMAGRMVRPDRLGSYFGTRAFLGTLAAIVAGAIVVQPVLGRVETPWNYVVLMIAGGAIATVGAAVFAFCREEDGPSARHPTTLGESLRRGLKWLRSDRNYRMYLGSRVAFRLNYVGLAFFIPYGSERLRQDGVSLAMLGGILVATMQGSRLVASLAWGRLADRRGFRPCLVGAGVLFLLGPLLALAAPGLPGVFSVTLPGAACPFDLPLVVYMGALACLGAAIQGNVMGGQHFIVSTAPPRRRASYLGFLNTVTSPLTLLPMGAALLARWAGMTAVLGIGLVGACLSLATSLRMRTPRPG